MKCTFQLNLVCGRKWISATITTIQMAGVFAGGLISGQAADTFGRKPTFFLSVLVVVAFNLAGYFPMGWQAYAAMRFLIGLGMGSYLTVQYSLMLEFATVRWRPPIVAAPSWPVEASLFALVAWALHDWQKMHLAIVIAMAPYLLAWW